MCEPQPPVCGLRAAQSVRGTQCGRQALPDPQTGSPMADDLRVAPRLQPQNVLEPNRTRRRTGIVTIPHSNLQPLGAAYLRKDPRSLGLPASRELVATVLTWLIAGFAACASLGGWSLPRLYRDNLWIASAFQGADLVTACLGVPLLLFAHARARSGSMRARLVWLGMLAYMLYNYAFYLFGARFNVFFLLYVELVSLPIIALLLALPRLDVVRIADAFDSDTPVRAVASFMAVSALSLGALWIGMSLSYVVSGEVPAPIVASEHPTGIVFALDLAWLVPALGGGAYLLWHRRPFGFVLAAMLTSLGSVYTLGLTVSSLVCAHAGVAGALSELPLWVALALGNLVCCVFLLRHFGHGADGDADGCMTPLRPQARSQILLRTGVSRRHAQSTSRSRTQRAPTAALHPARIRRRSQLQH